jgi:hypothetical protein
MAHGGLRIAVSQQLLGQGRLRGERARGSLNGISDRWDQINDAPIFEDLELGAGSDVILLAELRGDNDLAFSQRLDSRHD